MRIIVRKMRFQYWRKDNARIFGYQLAHSTVNNSTDCSNRSDGPRWVDFAFFRSARTAWKAFLEFSGCGRVRNAFPDEISVQTVAKQARWSRLKVISQKRTICTSRSRDNGSQARSWTHMYT